MIHYNMRHRGAYEYDKFVLNILQYANEAADFADDLTKIKDYKTLKMLCDEINDLYNKSTGDSGLSQQCYRKLIIFKEAK